MKLSEVKSLKSGAELKDCIFTVAGIEFVKFSEEDGVAQVFTKECVFNSDFGKNNNFSESKVLKKLNKEILSKLQKEIGEENIKEFELDLTSLDGLDTYGKQKTKIGLITLDVYRENVRLFDKCKLDCWWWLANPFSTPEHFNANWVLCVSPIGNVNSSGCSFNYGVRPFLHFVSSIFVS